MADDARNRLGESEVDRILAQYSPPNPLYDHRSYLAEYLQRAGQPEQSLDGVFRRNDLMQDRSVPTGWASGRYHPEPEPLPLGNPLPLPDVRPHEMREAPLGQSNFLDRVFRSIGQPSLDSLRRGLEGRETPAQVARTFLETGPTGPFGMARTPSIAREAGRRWTGSGWAEDPATYRLQVGSDFGSLTGTVDPANRSIRAGGAFVQENARGQGHGVALYQRLADQAAELGYVLHSDGPVSREAARMYEALRRRGYDVRPHPDLVVDQSGHAVVRGGSSADNAYTVYPLTSD